MGEKITSILKTLETYKVTLVLGAVLILVLLCYLLGYIAEEIPNAPKWLDFSINPTIIAFRGDLLAGVIVGLIFSFLLRREDKVLLEDVIEHTLNDKLKEQEDRILVNMLLNDTVVRQFMRNHSQEALLGNVLGAIIDDPNLSVDVQSILLHYCKDKARRRFNYYYSITMGQSYIKDARVLNDYRNMCVRIYFETELTGERFLFKCADNTNEFNNYLGDKNCFSVWLLPELRGDLKKPNKIIYELTDFKINGISGNINHKYNTNRYEIEVICPQQDLIGKIVSIEYSFRTLLHIDEHAVYSTIDNPTKGLRIEFDIGDSGIDPKKVWAVDYFTSREPARIIYAPKEKEARKITVEHQEWVFPKGGVVFIW